MTTKRYTSITHYTWRNFESWYLLRFLPFHQGLSLLFSVFLGLEWLGFAKMFPSDRVNYVSSKYHKFLWTRIRHFGKQPVIFNCSLICKETCKWANSLLKPLFVCADPRVRERLDPNPRAFAFKPITGCIQPLQPTCSFAGGFSATFFNACLNSLLPSASSFSSVMVTSGSGCHFSLSTEMLNERQIILRKIMATGPYFVTSW